MKVLVTGDRHYTDEIIVGVTLSGFRDLATDLFEDLVIIDGGATGADALARTWGKGYDNVKHITVDAEWDKYGKKAGPIRNRKMYDEHRPNVVLAFHDDLGTSKGTKDMVNYVRSKGGLVYHIRRDLSR